MDKCAKTNRVCPLQFSPPTNLNKTFREVIRAVTIIGPDRLKSSSKL